jgi:4-hydroxybenzoate polyprenyltransferase
MARRALSDDGLTSIIERMHLSYSALLGAVFGLAMLRAMLESRLLGEPLTTSETLAHLSIFFVWTFLAGGLILSWLSRTSFRSTLNLMILVWPVTVLTPLIEHYVLGSSDRYGYISTSWLASGGFSIDDPGGLGRAQLFQLAFFCIVGAVFVHLRSRSVGRSLAAIFMLAGLVVVSAMPGLIVPWLDPSRLPTTLPTGAIDSALVLYYMLLTVVLLSLGLAIDSRASLSDLRSAIRPWPTIIYGSVLLMAYVYGLRQSQITPGVEHVIDAGLLALGWALTWQSVVMFNDMYDMDIDRVAHPNRPLVRGIFDQNDYWDIASVLAALALLAVCVVSPISGLVIVVGAIGLDVLYSKPPIALKRRLWGAPAVMALMAGLLALGGFWAAGGDLDARAWFLGLVLMLVFALGVVTKDAHDQEGDSRAGARTLFTVLGRERGLRVCAMLVLASALLPLAVVWSVQSLVVCGLLALGAATAFGRTGDMRFVFPLYFVEMLFVGIRLVG